MTMHFHIFALKEKSELEFTNIYIYIENRLNPLQRVKYDADAQKS